MLVVCLLLFVAVAVVTVIFRHVLQKVIISDGLRRNNDFLAMTKSGEKNVEVPSGRLLVNFQSRANSY